MTEPDPAIGRTVEVRSVAGLLYVGVVRSIGTDEFGELFELGSPDNATYQRLVHVVDRLAQVRDVNVDSADM